MAEKSVQEVEEHLICPVCCERYHDPKQLPCQHIYCEECLDGLVKRRNNKTVIDCPCCREEVELSEVGVNSLPPARLAAKIMDICDRAKLGSTDVRESCLAHHKPHDLYCNDCDIFICCQCSMETHRDHSFDAISSCAKNSKEYIQQEFEFVQQKVGNLQSAFNALVELDLQLVEQESRAELQINALADTLIAKVRRSQQELLHKVSAATKAKRSIISAQKREADEVQRAVKNCQDSVNDLLLKSTYKQILTTKKQAIQQLEATSNLINLENLKQVESLDIRFQENENLEKIPLDNLGSVFSSHIHKQCSAYGKGLRVATVGEVASFEITAGEYNTLSTAIFSCQLKPENPRFVCRFSREVDSDGKIVGSYTPTLPGPHTLSVCVGGQDIPNSPFSLQVLPPAKEPIEIFEGLKKPHGIAVISCKGQLIVAEKGSDCITLVDTHQDVQRKSFPLSTPCGVAITADKQILAINQGDNSLIKVNMEEEEMLETIGGEEHFFSKARPLSFNKPVGVTVSPDGRIFVTEYGSHHLQVLHADLTYSNHIGSRLWGPLACPCDVALDSKGMVYVVNQKRLYRQVVVFSPDGEAIQKFGWNILHKPSAIAVSSNNTVFVADQSKHQIFVFSSKGEFLTQFGSKGNGKGEFNMPLGLTIDVNQVLYISDSGNNRIVAYKLQ